MKKSFKVLAVVLCLAMAMTLLAGCGGGSDNGGSSSSTTLKIAFSAGDSSTWYTGLSQFKEEVEKNTDGAVKVELYGSDQLTSGDQVAGLQAVIDGTTEMSMHSNIIWSSIKEDFAVITLPFLFTTVEDADKALDPEGEAFASLNQMLNDQGVELLGIGENGFRHVTNSKHEIAKPEDMKGVKIRVAGSTVLMEAYAAWGADYTKANWSEVYTGLQTGTYDGQENPLPTADSSSIQDVQKYATYWTGSYDVLFLTMNSAKWASFDEDTQAIIRTAAENACAAQKKANREEDEAVIKRWTDLGIEIHTMTEEEAQAFKTLSDPTYDNFRQRLIDSGEAEADVDAFLASFGVK